MRTDFDQRWRELSEEVMSGMREWRLHHPRATLREIEVALDERLAGLRARMLEDAALASAAADWKCEAGETIPVCQECGTPLWARGEHARTLQTQGGQTLTLARDYGVCPTCGGGFFPLDDELALVPGQLTPRVQEQLVRLGAWMPFDKAAVMLRDFTRVEVNEDYARRHTEEAGAAYVAVQTAEVERLERDTPPAPPGPEKLCLSADGAQVPLVGGEWAEVKTLAVGEVAAPVWERGDLVVRTQAVTYFSRLTDNHTFERLALVETHRRGVESAGQVGAVLDGAEWLQGFVDSLRDRRDAVRILDFPHGAEYLGKIGQAVYGEGTPESHTWLNAQLHQLKHEGPRDVLDALRALRLAQPDCAEISDALAYLDKREAQMHYPTFRAAGWPIGSGMVESGNKLVVEARLKGSGMHWARTHVDPLLALRNIVCNDRWAEAWPQIEAYQRQHATAAQKARRQKRHAARPSLLPGPMESRPVPRAEIASAREEASTSTPATPPPNLSGPHRPAPNHPWRRSPIGRAQYQPAKPREAAKL